MTRPVEIEARRLSANATHYVDRRLSHLPLHESMPSPTPLIVAVVLFVAAFAALIK